MGTRKRHPFALLIGIVLPVSLGLAPSLVNSASTGVDPGIGNVPQGTQSDQTYADSFAANHVTNVFVTSQQVSCYRPEVPFLVSNGPNDGYTGELPCPGATTHEDIGSVPYPTQTASQPPYPAGEPKLATDHSESDIRVDPTNRKHLIGSTKWFASPEGYNHLLGFYESFDGGNTWPTMGHVPGYEGFTDNTRWARSTPSATITRLCFPISSFTTNRVSISSRSATNRTPGFPTRRSRSPSGSMAQSCRLTGSRRITGSRITFSPPTPGLVRNRIKNGSRSTAIPSSPMARPIPTTTAST